MDSIQYLANKPEILRKISQDLKSQALSALNDIRRIAYNLRPPALDELGLVAALKQYVDANNHSNGLYILFEAPANLPELPAAVELAAYRIVLEAVNNVQRHAQATRCHVRMSCGSYLYLEIIDDGSGMPPSFVSGIGLNSMRERASELGGYFAIKPLKEDSGTIILAQLPLPENLQEEAR
jgi:signal transduction histidine kinase